MIAALEPRLLEILQHALGLDQYGRGSAYRNHFCAGENDEPDCLALVALGYMAEHKRTELYPYYNCSVTAEGRAAIRELSPAPPKRTRSQQRYDAYLNADTGYSFKEWLMDEKERRRK